MEIESLMLFSGRWLPASTSSAAPASSSAAASNERTSVIGSSRSSADQPAVTISPRSRALDPRVIVPYAFSVLRPITARVQDDVRGAMSQIEQFAPAIQFVQEEPAADADASVEADLQYLSDYLISGAPAPAVAGPYKTVLIQSHDFSLAVVGRSLSPAKYQLLRLHPFAAHGRSCLLLMFNVHRLPAEILHELLHTLGFVHEVSCS